MGGMPAEFRESSVESGLASTEADSESAIGIKLGEPAGDRLKA
jgi:hypothetical protein